jgi:hypothetical protein
MTAHKKKRTNISAEKLRRRLKLKHIAARNKIDESLPHVSKFFKAKGLDPAKIREHSAKILGAGAIAGTLLLSPTTNIKALPAPHEVVDKLKLANTTGEITSPQKVVVETLSSVLPTRPRPLDRSEEKFLEQLFQNLMGVKTRATLEGEHLNTTYGFIGAEQHLRRYPGDSLELQTDDPVIKKSGMAPGLGAWGYFASSKDAMTPYLDDVEKWYAVVQTLYLPDWNARQPYLKNWYKYRKVLIVNTDNGNAVIAAVADSGPAAWTGKQFGGSPEVMNYLGGERYKKGAVIIFFIDDPENEVKLGPVEYDKPMVPEFSLSSI